MEKRNSFHVNNWDDAWIWRTRRACDVAFTQGSRCRQLRHIHRIFIKIWFVIHTLTMTADVGIDFPFMAQFLESFLVPMQTEQPWHLRDAGSCGLNVTKSGKTWSNLYSTLELTAVSSASIADMRSRFHGNNVHRFTFDRILRKANSFDCSFYHFLRIDSDSQGLFSGIASTWLSEGRGCEFSGEKPII